jgi:probable FeS assembly SUF system protein SufT
MHAIGNTVVLTRDVEAIQIPSGDKIALTKDSSVVITQALGGSYTVLVNHQPGLFRISEKDGDALGDEKKSTESEIPLSEESVWNQLKQCFDPEIPVNIVDLGLIYDVALDKGNVLVKMTLTAQGCGMGPAIAADAREKILQISGVDSAEVELVWEPAWTPERISEAGKEKLGII